MQLAQAAARKVGWVCGISFGFRDWGVKVNPATQWRKTKHNVTYRVPETLRIGWNSNQQLSALLFLISLITTC